MTARTWLVALTATLGACGVSSEARSELSRVHSIAVLPFQGEGSLADRELVRTWTRERLATLNLRVCDNRSVDRVLAERGWLADPERFDPAALDSKAACAALGVDAVLFGRDLEERSLDLLVLFRRSFGGELICRGADGSQWWRASYTAARSGGVLIKSGQLFDALAEHFEKGSSRTYAALVGEYLDDVLATLPRFPADALQAAPPPMVAAIDHMTRRTGATGPGAEWVELSARATPGTEVRFDLAGALRGLPTWERAPGEFTGIHARVPNDGLVAGALPVTLHVRDRSGREQTLQVESAPTSTAAEVRR